MIRQRKACVFVLLITAVFLAPGSDLVITCLPRDLETLGGNTSIGAAVDNLDRVVGGSETAEGQWHAFLWQDRLMTDLGTLGGGNSEAHAISRGLVSLVVGTSEIPGPNGPNQPVDRAFLWQEGTMTDLGTLGGTSSEAWGVSDTGIVVGSAQTPNDTWHAFAWEDGVITDLGTLGGDQSCAMGVNSIGQIVGWSMKPGAPYDGNDLYPTPVRRAFLWTAALGMQELSTLGGLNSSAQGITEDGYVIGWSDTSAGTAGDPNQLVERHAVLWHPDGTIQDLGTLGGPMAEGWSIASTGAVGYGLDPNGVLQAFLWEPGYPLETLGQPLDGNGPVFAHGIGGASHIVGSANTAGGDEHAFLRR